MQRKRSEKEARKTLKAVQLFREPFVYKFRDQRICQHCHKQLWKTEDAPDLLFAPIWTYIECKQGTDRWDFINNGFTDIQQQRLNEYGGWLYLLLGPGRAPDGVAAFLIPWRVWMKHQAIFKEDGHSSIRLDGGRVPSASEYLNEYRLFWQDGRFNVPGDHIFYKAMHKASEKALL